MINCIYASGRVTQQDVPGCPDTPYDEGSEDYLVDEVDSGTTVDVITEAPTDTNKLLMLGAVLAVALIATRRGQ